VILELRVTGAFIVLNSLVLSIMNTDRMVYKCTV